MADDRDTFHPLSWADPAGRLFWRDGNLYRGIRGPRAELFRSLLGQGTIRELAARPGLIDSWPTDWSTDEFPLIVQHRVIPVVSYPSEWCASQLRSAALLVLDLELALRPHRLTLVDVHPWNVLFDGPTPSYVDLTSIAPLAHPDRWEARSQFHEFFLNPLLLFDRMLPRVARRLLHDPWRGVSEIESVGLGLARSPASPARRGRRAVKRVAASVIPRRLHPAVSAVVRRVRARASAAFHTVPDPAQDIRVLRERVEALSLASPATHWAEYYRENFPPLTPSPRWTAKHHSIHRVIADLRPDTVLDVGANRGWYAQLAARSGARVIAADGDDAAINEVYADTRASGLPILAAVMDVRFPEPGQGPAYTMLAPVSVRFRSDMVLALALVHHLVFTWNLSFEQIVATLGMFVRTWLVIEFVGPGDAVVRSWEHDRYPWYTVDNFVACLGRSFEIVSRLPSDYGGLDDKEHDRVILVCRRSASSA